MKQPNGKSLAASGDAAAAITEIQELLWPASDPERSWSPDTLDAVADVVRRFLPDQPVSPAPRDPAAEIKTAMLEAVIRIQQLWDAERRLEAALGATVDGIEEYLKDYAVADGFVPTDEDVDALMTWTRRQSQ